MNIVIGVYCLAFFVTTSLSPAQWFLGKSEVDPQMAEQKAEQCAWSYHELSSHLYKVVDSCTSYSVFAKTDIHKWIERSATKEFNVVSLYFYVRNFFEKVGPTLISDNLNASWDIDPYLEALLFCLYRVAFDGMQLYYHSYLANGGVADASLFNKCFQPYAILKNKFHYLLTYIPKLNLAKLPTYKDRDAKAKLNIDQISYTTIQFPNRWLESFSWGSCLYKCYGISFGVPQYGVAEMRGVHYQSNKNLFIRLVKTLNKDIRSWENFFATYEFPLKQEVLNQAIRFQT